MKEKNSVLVIYGGSFNPPTNTHFSIAEQVINQYDQVDKVAFVPVSNKYEKDELADERDRYNMLKLVIDKNEKFILSDIDMNQEKSLTTIEVMNKMQEQFPDKDIWFLMGSDNLKSFSAWNNSEQIILNYKIIVMTRDADILEKTISNDELLSKYRNNILTLNEEIKTNFSATYIRNQLKNDKSIRYLVPEEVYKYIKDRNLYKK